MAKKILIDATHLEEMRVAVVDGQILEDFDSETSTKKQIKGNIYLAKIIRVEPSLQAAFVDFGENRHGFLPFSEIHPDYYRLPISDRSSNEDDHDFSEKEDNKNDSQLLLENSGIQDSEDLTVVREINLSEDENSEKTVKKAAAGASSYRYKIQEVIKRRHIMLVQVVKEERGNKGASLTTYLSLPGRYCVLMPNAGYRAGGVSRKINDGDDRRRLKDVVKDLSLPEGMALIVRTAGQERNKNEIRRDYEYLSRLWGEIRDLTLKSIAPFLVYAEGDLLKKAIRDIYNRDIDEILVEGEEAYKQAKAFMKQLIPSHVRKIKLYHDESHPLFHQFKVEEQINQMMHPMVKLPSGGSMVINLTEALVAIDVNSGRSTRERHIDETALKTNLEAAEEVARQIRLRDLAGLIVIDFIDMNENSHIQQVEKKLREALKDDRARIQLGKISQFGLMELSRQRLRPSLIETHTISCNHCNGTGLIRSVESMALHALRAIETFVIQNKTKEIVLTVPAGVDLYLLNQKRQNLVNLEAKLSLTIRVDRDSSLNSPDFKIDAVSIKEDTKKEKTVEERNFKEAASHHKNPPNHSNSQNKGGSPAVVQHEEKLNGEKLASKSRNRRRSKRRRSSLDQAQNPSLGKIDPQETTFKEVSPAEIQTNDTAKQDVRVHKVDSQKSIDQRQFYSDDRRSRNRGKSASKEEIDSSKENTEAGQFENQENLSSKKKDRGWLRRLLDS